MVTALYKCINRRSLPKSQIDRNYQHRPIAIAIKNRLAEKLKPLFSKHFDQQIVINSSQWSQYFDRAQIRKSEVRPYKF